MAPGGSHTGGGGSVAARKRRRRKRAPAVGGDKAMHKKIYKKAILRGMSK